MASVRNLKKDIDYLVSLVVVDCFQYVTYFKEVNKEAAYKIVDDILSTRDELRARVNHPDGKDNPKLIKNYYQDIAKDLMQSCDNAYEELGKLVEKSAS
ncbi:MAG TPA: hypothetical protein VKA27_13700 [Sunxiuqinia sp.]|nr:hypothetical protein [Sunxiuqinia sp.]